MSIAVLQEKIRARKTPVALELSPVFEKISPRIVKGFANMFGDAAQTKTESLRYHCTELLEAAEPLLPAVVLDASAFLRHGYLGLEVLENLTHIARGKGLYTIVDAKTTDPALFLEGAGAADAVTVTPYLGSDSYAVPEGKAVFVVLRTANPSAGEVQNLMAGDRKLYAAVGEQVARRGGEAGVVIGTGYSLDIRDLRRRTERTFFLLPHCGPEAASYGCDEFGRGILVPDAALEWAEDPAAAMADTIREMKKWVTIV